MKVYYILLSHSKYKDKMEKRKILLKAKGFQRLYVREISDGTFILMSPVFKKREDAEAFLRLSYQTGVSGKIKSYDTKYQETYPPRKFEIIPYALNVREEPSKESPVLFVITQDNVKDYHIIQSLNHWGRIKERIGWVDLSFVKDGDDYVDEQ